MIKNIKLKKYITKKEIYNKKKKLKKWIWKQKRKYEIIKRIIYNNIVNKFGYFLFMFM